MEHVYGSERSQIIDNENLALIVSIQSCGLGEERESA